MVIANNITQIQSSVIRIDYPVSYNNEIDQLWLGCVHFDSKHCNRKLVKKLLEQASTIGALIFFIGDNNDIMQGIHDRRAKKVDMDPKHMRTYLDEVIDETIEFLSPYAKNIAMIGYGNHEEKVIKHCETDPVKRIVNGLNDKHGSSIKTGGWAGWVRCMFIGEQKKSKSIDIYYSHSSGSLGKRTKGILAADILRADYPDADVYVVADGHVCYAHPTTVEGLTYRGNLEWRKKLILQLPSFKEEWKDETKRGFWFEKNLGPRIVGGYWLNMKMKRKTVGGVDNSVIVFKEIRTDDE